jgi:amidase
MNIPTTDQIADIMATLGLAGTEADAESYRALVEGSTAGNAIIDELPDPDPATDTTGREWTRPKADDNPWNAWYVTTRIRESETGRLADKKIAIKDNVFVAGVPMMNGTTILEGYIPPNDATIVTRMLAEGAVITGKAVCEAYCFSGGSHTSQSGPVQNPRKPTHSAGGSSSGSAALVAGGIVDMAIGCDQGGSIRIPSSFSGIYGMKPTNGLVPYTGILGMGAVIDHTGPMTASVEDNALLLEVTAGADGLDTRQYNPRTERYTEALGKGVEGLRVGVVNEGFGHDTSEADVDEKVREAADRFTQLGATVTELSLPAHPLGAAISFAVIQQTIETMFHTDGCLLYRLDPTAASYLEIQRTWRENVNELPETIKLMLITCEFVRRNHGYHYVARGNNLVRWLRAAYDQALTEVDLLMMPTTPMKAPALPPADAPREVVIDQAFPPLTNTMPFNNTHHPAMSLPCGLIDGLPIGMMLVGRHFEESTIYRAAHAFEQSGDWRTF